MKKEQHHGKVLLRSFHLNGNTLEFHPDSKVTTTLYSIIKRTTGKYCSVALILSGHGFRLHQHTDSKVSTPVYSVIRNVVEKVCSISLISIVTEFKLIKAKAS